MDVIKTQYFIFIRYLNNFSYCLPILKRNIHQQALIKAATSGSPKFFLGTDSAPHAVDKKETACGFGGIYSAYASLELYAEVFEQAGALDKLEAFASFNGPDFYNLPRNTDTITLEKSHLDQLKAQYGRNWQKVIRSLIAAHFRAV